MNAWARPCYVASGQTSAVLPTGIPPTDTPSPTPDLTTAFTAIVNPGADWQRESVRWARANLEVIAPTDYRLAGTELEIADENLIYTWTDEDENTYELTIALQIIDGALEPVIETYTVNGQPADPGAIQDLSFIIRENILLDSIPPGNYRLENIEFEENAVVFTFSIPPGE